MRVGLLYDVVWSTPDGSTGEFVLEGELSEWKDLTVGEVGTVVSDGTAPRQEEITAADYTRDVISS